MLDATISKKESVFISNKRFSLIRAPNLGLWVSPDFLDLQQTLSWDEEEEINDLDKGELQLDWFSLCKRIKHN